MRVTANWAEQFFDAFAQWARTRADIVGVAAVGSFGRGTATPASDLDLVVLTTAPADYFTDTAWARGFGVVRKEEQEDWGALRALRVWYAEGREVEYGFTLPAWARVPLDEGTRAVAGAGIQVLFDRQGVLERLRRAIVIGR